jgi:hypothetical protein
MGYRSDVAIAMLDEVVPLFDQATKTVAERPETYFTCALDSTTADFHQSEGETLLYWKGIKAYDLHDVLVEFRRLLDEKYVYAEGCDTTKDPSDFYHYVRLGEEPRDEDDEGCLEDAFELSFERKITFNK